MSYVILAWNDLGMHCDQNDIFLFYGLASVQHLEGPGIAPRQRSASLITSGVTVTYEFPKKKNSALHTNFWAFAPQFGCNAPINVGIPVRPLAGEHEAGGGREELGGGGHSHHPPYDDDGTWDPYGTAIITVKDIRAAPCRTRTSLPRFPPR